MHDMHMTSCGSSCGKLGIDAARADFISKSKLANAMVSVMYCASPLNRRWHYGHESNQGQNGKHNRKLFHTVHPWPYGEDRKRMGKWLTNKCSSTRMNNWEPKEWSSLLHCLWGATGHGALECLRADFSQRSQAFSNSAKVNKQA